ncbi:MAG: hypothetical protein IPL52_15635 [Flavobacteriales bacterium]|nr:hypothetical protein [Flavobacteriales bacterium]
MKALFTTWALFLATLTVAQGDTTATKPDTTTYPGLPMLNLGVSSTRGAYVEVINTDTIKDKSHFTIDMKYKRITVITEPKPWASTSDSIAEVIHDRKVERRNQFTYWSGVDIGVNTLLAADGSTDLPKEAEFLEIDNTKSRFVSINFMEQKIEFGTHHVGLLTGLGWEFVNYRLKNNALLAYNADSLYGMPMDEPDFRKNKLRQMGLRMPLMLEFNTQRSPLPTEADVMAMRADTTGALRRTFKPRHDRNFHIAIGVVGSWYFDTMYKQKYTVEGNDRKDRDKGDYLLLPYRAAAAVRVGYGGLNLFAEYALTPLLKDGKGPELTPFTVGLTIIGFN